MEIKYKKLVLIPKREFQTRLEEMQNTFQSSVMEKSEYNDTKSEY